MTRSISRHTVIHRRLLCLALCATSACTGGERSTAEDPIEVVELVRSRTPALSDSVGPFFIHPFAMAFWKDSLVVADLRQSAVIVLPWSLEGGREFGVQGEGPGELRRPQGLASVGDTLVVFDRSNARVSWFDPQGRFLYSRQLMILAISPTFHPREGGGLVVPQGMPSHYALVDSAGTQVPIVPRSENAKPASEGPITSNLIVATDDGIAVIDAENGLVVFEGSDGSHTSSPIPASLRAAIDPRVDSLRAQDPEGLRVINPILTAGEAPGGVLVWFPGRGNPCGAVVDRSGKWRAVTAVEDLQELPVHPADVLLRGNELYLLFSDGLRVYRIRE